MIAALLLLQAVQSPLGARADTAPPVHDALHYDIALVIPDTGNHVVGQIETTWRLASDAGLQLTLDSSLFVVRIITPGAGGRRGDWARKNDLIYVPSHRKAGDTLLTRIRYHGPVRKGMVFGRNPAGGRTVFADNWPDRARGWLPSQDHPADKATAAFHIEVGPGLEVIANGVLEKVDTLVNRRTVWHYRIRQPIPTYTMVFGVAPFAVTEAGKSACAVRCVPQSVWTYAADSAAAVNGPFRRIGEMVEFFSRTFGEFPYDQLAHVQAATLFGGMENAGAIWYDESAIAAGRLSEGTVAHEIGHQWFGDAVTEGDWHHLWLSEGFATYLAALWAEHGGGDSALAAEMRGAARSVLGSKDTERPILDLQATDLMGLLNTNNYPKGAWVLHSLRGIVGDSAFFRGMRDYYATYRNGNALSDDFARVMSRASGQDLGWYFTQALTQPGYPVLEVSSRMSAGRLILTLRQVQKPEWGTYRMPGLELLMDGQLVRVDVEGRETSVTLDGFKARPKRIEVDPNGWWLVSTRTED